jgi:hypothetical protein
VPEIVTRDVRVVDSISFDGGTDSGDDVTMYLIEVPSEKGYLIVPDSFHIDPRKAAFIDALFAKSGALQAPNWETRGRLHNDRLADSRRW